MRTLGFVWKRVFDQAIDFFASMVLRQIFGNGEPFLIQDTMLGMDTEAQQAIERAVELGIERYSLEESIQKLKGDRKFRRSKYRLRIFSNGS